MSTKGYLILASWLVFIGLLSWAGKAINWSVYANYHPKDRLSPYYKVGSSLWFEFTAFALVLAVILSAGRSVFSVRGIYLTITTVYGIFILLAGFSLLTVKVPNYFVHSVGDIRHHIPREFTKFPRNNDSVVRLDLCLSTLKGIYSKDRGCRRAQTVLLSPKPIEQRASHDLRYLLEKTQGFNLEQGQVIATEAANHYRLAHNNSQDLISYTVRGDRQNATYHLQFNKQNELVRFVYCRFISTSKRETNICEHWASISLGTLNYQLEGTADFEPQQWQQQDEKLLELIAQWRIDENKE